MRKVAPIFACAVILISLTVLLGGCIVIGGFGDPEADVAHFFDGMSSGNYAEADEYIDNYKSLGFGGGTQTPLQERFMDLLNSSRSYKIIGEVRVNGKSGSITVELTTLDFRKLEEFLSDTIDARKNDGEALDSEESIETALFEILEEITDMSVYYTTGQFALGIKYSDSRWKLIVSEIFYSAMTGYAT